ncbi:MAG: hypothetical protein Kow0081_2210 [Candidatus Dojkabacteria bacterium]
MRKLSFFIYAWSTTFVFTAFLLWLGTIPNIISESSDAELIKIIYRLTLYGLLFLLIYRSFITTLRFTIERLAEWRSKREKQEDQEFVLIVETLVTLLSITCAIIIAFIDEMLQSPYGLNIEGREFQVQDILVSTMGILLASMIVYSVPVIGELEITLKNKFEDLVRKINYDKKRKKSS